MRERAGSLRFATVVVLVTRASRSVRAFRAEVLAHFSAVWSDTHDWFLFAARSVHSLIRVARLL